MPEITLSCEYGHVSYYCSAVPVFCRLCSECRKYELELELLESSQAALLRHAARTAALIFFFDTNND